MLNYTKGGFLMVNAKKRTSYSKTVKNYVRYREFIRNVMLYSYRSRKDYKEIGINERTYDDFKRILIDCIDNGFIEEVYINKVKCMRFKADFYESSYNFLSNTYLNKSLRDNSFYYILILQILSDGASMMTVDIHNAIWDYDLNCDIDGNDLGIYRAAEDLTSMGLLTAEVIDRKKYYKISNNILDTLTEGEILELYTAISFFSNTALLSVPGYYFKQTLEKYLDSIGSTNTPSTNIWQYRCCNYSKIVDDEVLSIATSAIRNNNSLEIKVGAKKHPFRIDPKYISTTYPTGRSYLHSADGSTYKIDNINDIKEIKIATQQLAASKTPKLQCLHLIFTFNEKDNAFEVANIKERLKREAAWMKQKQLNENSFEFVAMVEDGLAYVPWIRTFHKYVSPGEKCTPRVVEHLINNRLEALKNYGIIQ